MAANAIFNAHNLAVMPFHFWSLVFFVFGITIGSFLNVCIHRMPLEESIVSPPSHCPHCRYSIPWFLNIPLVTWLYLRGKCANCHAPISIRYFLVELMTGLLFLGCWLAFGHQSVALALVYCLFLAGLIVATFIDLEHLIIPDEITIGGMVVGFICSLLVPALHGRANPAASMKESLWGMLIGGGLIYAIVRLGKLAFGRQKLQLPAGTRVVFTETAIVLPDNEIPFDGLFYRKNDAVKLEASRVELADRCYQGVTVRLTATQLEIGEDAMDPESVPFMEVFTDKLILPREAMGLADVKFMAAIGAFLGWHAVIFSFFLSCVLGAVFGIALIAVKRESWRDRVIPYGPYIAVAAAAWIFGGHRYWDEFWKLVRWR